MMTFSEIMAAHSESTGMNATQSAGEGSAIENGAWNLGKSTLENSNLKKLRVGKYISAEDLGRTFVATVDTNRVKSKNQDEKGVSEYQKLLILLNFYGVETSTNAQNVQVE